MDLGRSLLVSSASPRVNFLMPLAVIGPCERSPTFGTPEWLLLVVIADVTRQMKLSSESLRAKMARKRGLRRRSFRRSEQNHCLLI